MQNINYAKKNFETQINFIITKLFWLQEKGIHYNTKRQCLWLNTQQYKKAVYVIEFNRTFTHFK